MDFPPRGWNRVDVVVGAPRVLAPRILGGVRELASVGRPRVTLAAAERAGWHIVHGARGEIEKPVAIGADHEEMRARAIVPRIPVAIHERIGDVRLHGIRVDRLLTSDVARIVGARREDARGERDPIAVGRPHRPRRAAGECGELLARGARGIRDPELIAGDERDALSIGRPARLADARAGVGKCGWRTAGDRALST